MSQYFILLPGDTESDCLNDTNILGESSLGSFYTGSGMKALSKIINFHPELVPSITIKNDKGKKYEIQEFLTEIESFKIIHQRWCKTLQKTIEKE